MELPFIFGSRQGAETQRHKVKKLLKRAIFAPWRENLSFPPAAVDPDPAGRQTTE